MEDRATLVDSPGSGPTVAQLEQVRDGEIVRHGQPAHPEQHHCQAVLLGISGQATRPTQNFMQAFLVILQLVVQKWVGLGQGVEVRVIALQSVYVSQT